MIDIGIFSNGHGEDTIACKVLERLRSKRPSLTVEAWPMVGEGDAYKAMDVPLVGARNLLPSSGFATISPTLMLNDLRAGWIRTYWQQYVSARSMRGRYRFVLAVGDVIPTAASAAAQSPFMFIGCAKSYYYNPGHAYQWHEKWLLRRHCMLTFPRDLKTVPELKQSGVPALYVGNPMMDGLEGSGDRLGVGANEVVVAMLAGTRPDAEENLLDLLDATGHVHRHVIDGNKLHFIFAARPGLDVEALAEMMRPDPRFANWQVAAPAKRKDGTVLQLTGPYGTRATIAKGRFADVLQMSTLVVGMAGTANEQAIGLGKPLIAIPSSGVQGQRYVRMKARYFGDAALTVSRDPDTIAAAIGQLLADPERRARMGDAGRERMGEPGASQAIADLILDVVENRAVKAAAE